MKQLTAELKDKITAVVNLDYLDFNKDMLHSAAIVNDIKARIFLEIKQKMHEKIATLSLEDIKFEIK